MQVGGVVSHEGQLLYVLKLLGPILHRIMAEKPKLLLDIVMEIYRLLKVVDQRQKGLLQHSDIICDFLYPTHSTMPFHHTVCWWLHTLASQLTSIYIHRTAFSLT